MYLLSTHFSSIVPLIRWWSCLPGRQNNNNKSFFVFPLAKMTPLILFLFFIFYFLCVLLGDVNSKRRKKCSWLDCSVMKSVFGAWAFRFFVLSLTIIIIVCRIFDGSHSLNWATKKMGKTAGECLLDDGKPYYCYVDRKNKKWKIKMKKMKSKEIKRSEKQLEME